MLLVGLGGWGVYSKKRVVWLSEGVKREKRKKGERKEKGRERKEEKGEKEMR